VSQKKCAILRKCKFNFLECFFRVSKELVRPPTQLPSCNRWGSEVIIQPGRCLQPLEEEVTNRSGCWDKGSSQT